MFLVPCRFNQPLDLGGRMGRWVSGPAGNRINEHGRHHRPSADRRSGMVEIGFGTFLAGRYQDGGTTAARHSHGVVTVRARGQGTAATVSEIEAVELFARLRHTILMVAG